MNIAFYGKGGSGKTTTSALFATYLDNQGHNVGLLDADVNSHTAEIVGAVVDSEKILSLEKNEADIWEYLAGSNPRVKKTEFLNTTPPGSGSAHWTMDSENYLTKQYGQPFGKQSNVFTIGSYKQEKLGNGCHHGTQTIAENMISHAKFDGNDVLVVDSVAGNDAFGTTLFLNDILVFVVKPEREGITVLQRFLALAEHAGVADRVLIVGNQVMHEAQREFLKREVPAEKLVGILEINDIVMERRLADEPLGMESVGEAEAALFQVIIDQAKKLGTNKAARYKHLLELHHKVASEGWVAGSYRTGLQDQIDPGYQPA